MNSLPFVIRGQQGGIDSVLNAVSVWEFKKGAGLSSAPLVLAIVGPTGVGKSETGDIAFGIMMRLFVFERQSHLVISLISSKMNQAIGLLTRSLPRKQE